MVNSTMRVLTYSATVGGCAALVASILLVTDSAAQGDSEARRQTNSVANSTSPSPLFGVKIQKGYRDWRLISVAHEEGDKSDIRAILGNDIAINSYRSGKHSFPDGAVIARLAWSYIPSEANDKAFGRAQSFVAGPPTGWYLQFMVKDSKKYAATGGWGFAQFDKDGIPVDDAALKPCFPCHVPAKADDFVFTHYAP